MLPIAPMIQAAGTGDRQPSATAKSNGETIGIPVQAEELTRELFDWVRDDSLGLMLAVAVGVGIYFLLLVIRGWVRKRSAKTDMASGWPWTFWRVAARTRSFFVVMVSAQLISLAFDAPPTVSSIVNFLFTITTTLQGAIWARELLLSLVERKSAERGFDDNNLSSAVGVLTTIINVVVWAVAGIILLDNLGVNVTGLVAGLGIGGIAIGLAAQGIFSDLFAALSILLDQPFKVGDTIQIGGPTGIIGTVEHIGLKTTRLRALSGEVVVMSNNNILNQQINNFADFAYRRVVLLVEVLYQTDHKLLKTIPSEFENIVNDVPMCRFDRAHLFQFAESALDYELVFFVDHEGLREMWDARQAVMLAIVHRFGELGIDFAFPALVSYMAGPDGRIVDPHAPDSPDKPQLPDAESRDRGGQGAPAKAQDKRMPAANRLALASARPKRTSG